jgi:3-hydroxyisobutyrate dehydrogenase-like beta-hydroxyacid dehydrogenase
MGAAVASSAIDAGCAVYWVPAGRRPQTRQRAERAGLREADSLAELCDLCPVILSVCPPEFADEVAQAVAAQGFRGVFADLNALAPAHKIHMAQALERRGIRFVDGGIIGLPTRTPGQTNIFLSGAEAEAVARCFAGGAIAAVVLGGEVGRASALKILFAGYNKGMIALFSALFSAAESYGVLEDLRRQLDQRGLSLATLDAQIVRAAPKAWRWAPEMVEIGVALQAQGLPGEFHAAARQIYQRLAEFKDAQAVTVADVVAALRRPQS